LNEKFDFALLHLQAAQFNFRLPILQAGFLRNKPLLSIHYRGLQRISTSKKSYVIKKLIKAKVMGWETAGTFLHAFLVLKLFGIAKLMS